MKASLVIIALALAGCSGTDMETSQGRLDEPFRMSYQERTTIPSENLALTFTHVAEGRCPRPMLCIVAGHADVTIVASKPGAPTESLVLTIGDTTGPSTTATYLDYTVTIQELIPYPTASQAANPEKYVATVVVLKP